MTQQKFELLQPIEGYRDHFMDLDIWDVPVRQALSDHGLACRAARPGLAGTFPTFIVDEQYVIKFFGPLFEGPGCFAVEKAVGHEMVQAGLPAPALLCSGELTGQSGWQYLVFEYVPGGSIGEVYERTLLEDKIRVAAWLGQAMAGLHTLAIPAAVQAIYPRDPIQYARRLHGWYRSRAAQNDLGLPGHLAVQCASFLDHSGARPAAARLHLIHADISRDHILGDFNEGRWAPKALIDFGDSMSGDLYYELAAVHLDLFDADTRLLHACLDAYGEISYNELDFASCCLAAAVQHQFNVFEVVFERHPQLTAIGTLPELANQLWVKGLQ